jgi:DNA polymerase
MPESLRTIAAEVRGCQKCRLSHTRTVGVPGEGSPNAEIFFIGEGPGFHEDQQGRPFVGAAGQLLTDMLSEIGLRREEVFITNVVRCRPPGNRDPLPDELSACDEYTLRQIEALQPKLIVTLGRYSMARFFGPGSMRDLHGRTKQWNGATCLALYHPAAVLRTNTPEMRRIYADDFRRIPALLAEARKARSMPRPVAAPAQLPMHAEPEPEPAAELDQLPLF